MFNVTGRFTAIVCLAVLLICEARSSRILIYSPTMCHSHVSFNGKLADLLVEAGHDVVHVLPDIDSTVATNGSKYATVLRVSVNMERTRVRKIFWMNPGPFEDNNPVQIKMGLKYWRINNVLNDACEAIANNDELLRTLHQFQFDIGLLEPYDSCGLGLMHSLGIATKMWLSVNVLWRSVQPFPFRLEYPLSFVPDMTAPFSDEMQFSDRLDNFIVSQTSQFIHYLSQATETEIFRRQNGRDFPDLFDLSARSHLSLINNMLLLNLPNPRFRNVLYSGGFTMGKSHRRLSDEWSKIADSAKKGVVLVSFGGITQTIDMPEEMQMTLFRVIAKFSDYTFVVKYENVTTTERVASNIYLTNWIPQVELMNHHKYRALITHAGWSSILEALYNGSPMLLIPLFVDHFMNAKIVEKRRVGIIVDKMEFTMESFFEALQNVLHDSSFTRNARRYSQMMQDAPVRMEQLLVQQIRFAERHHKNLQRHSLASQRLRFHQYRFVDLFAILSLGSLLVGFLLS